MSELARLQWRCRRGMRELDNLLRSWLDNHYDNATEADQAKFRELLEQPDPLLIALLSGRPADSIDPEISSVDNFKAMERHYENIFSQIRTPHRSTNSGL